MPKLYQIGSKVWCECILLYCAESQVQCLNAMSSHKRTRSVARDEPPARAPPGKRCSKRSGRGTEDTGSDHQTGSLTRDDIPAIVQAVLDALSQRNSGNAVAHTAGTPISQGVESPHMRQAPTDAS